MSSSKSSSQHLRQSFLDFGTTDTHDMLLFPPPKSSYARPSYQPRGRSTTLPAQERPPTSFPPSKLPIAEIPEEVEEEDDRRLRRSTSSTNMRSRPSISGSLSSENGSWNSYDSGRDSVIHDLERRRLMALNNYNNYDNGNSQPSSTSTRSQSPPLARYPSPPSPSKGQIPPNRTSVQSGLERSHSLRSHASMSSMPVSLPNIQALILEDEMERRKRMIEQRNVRVYAQMDMHKTKRSLSVEGTLLDSLHMSAAPDAGRIAKYLGDLGTEKERMGGEEIFSDTAIKYHPSSTSFLKQKSRLQPPVLIPHLHVYKSNSPTSPELERLQILPSSVICVCEDYPGASTKLEKRVTIVLKVTGLALHRTGTELTRKEDEWFFEMEGGEQVKEWIKRLKEVTGRS
ncbi:hypothetical protein BT69DRAFT_1279357 [Atractiella rhizophila]|nr:hypothetical protein BT69DRAFT_1279357 [Atractiella rhizophila]